MATVAKTITQINQQDRWVESQIGANDVDANRRDQQRRAQAKALGAALIAGENSGKPRAFMLAIFKQRMRTHHG